MFGFGRRPEMELWEAVLANEVDRVRELLQDDPPLAQALPPRKLWRGQEGLSEEATPLHEAAKRGHTQVIKLLLVAGADVNAQAEGATPLHEAASGGHAEAAELLLFRQPNINATDNAGQTPLHRAALAGHEKVADLLLSRGADVEAVDGEGNTVLHCLAAGGCVSGVHRVLAVGAEVDPCNEPKRRTPLHMVMLHASHSILGQAEPTRASERARMERIARLLIEHGTDVNALDASDNTPLDLFHYLHGDDESHPLVRLLRKHGGRWMHYRHRHTNSPVTEDHHASDHHLSASGEHATPALSPGGSAVARRSVNFIGKPISLETGSLLVGRNPECDVRYRSRTLSRRHAQITLERGVYMIHDLGSHNGVLINGRKIHAPHLLSPGEIITLGAYEFEFDGQNLIPLRDELDENELRAELRK